jgi:hypothetical protein
MSTAKLNVWVTKVGEPCAIDDKTQWFVHVLHCNGKILEWCGKKYTNLPTKCGHLDVEIPPGCYMVCATWSPGGGATVPTSLGNHISHLSIIRANCGDHVCVTLFPPTFHWCGIWWLIALRENASVLQREGGAELARNAENAVTELLAKVPADPLTQEMLKIELKPIRTTTGGAKKAGKKGTDES